MLRLRILRLLLFALPAALPQPLGRAAAEHVGDEQGERPEDEVLDRAQGLLARFDADVSLSEKTISSPSVMLVT